MSLREKFSIARIAPLVFFLALLVWIAAKTAYSFTDEFPALSLLCKWDCGWYESIARQGYLSPVPPLFQDSENSNVAFFPAYPMLGRGVAALLGIPLHAALPLVSILFSILVSIALAKLFAEETRFSRFFRYAILVAYPASFYLFVSYSEALYLAAILGGISLLVARAPTRFPFGQGLLALGGLALGGTRLTGFVVPSFLLLGSAVYAFRGRKVSDLLGDPIFRRAAVFFGCAVFATAAFFAYCQIVFGHWNLYFWQLAIGWYKEFSPLKALSILVNRPFPPTLDYALLLGQSRRLSWMLISGILLISVYAVVRAGSEARKALATGDRPTVLRCFLVFAAFAHFFIVISGDVGPWDYWGNGLRYPMPTVYLLVVAWRDEWTPEIIRKNPTLRFLSIAVAAAVLAYLFALQVGYLERFIRNQWVS